MVTPEQIRKVYTDVLRREAPGSVREGSFWTTQIASPLALLTAPVLARLDWALGHLTPPSPGTADENLDVVGRRFFLPRNLGSKSTVGVRVYVADPIFLSVPQGAEVRTEDGRSFRAITNISYGQTLLEPATWNGIPCFRTPAIQFAATRTGSAGEVTSYEVVAALFAVPGLLGVDNPAASSTAGNPEADHEYRTRLFGSISTRSADTLLGLLTIIGDRFGSLTSNLIVIPAGDPRMERDRVYVRRLVNAESSDFKLTAVRSGTGVLQSLSFEVNGVSVTAPYNSANAYSLVVVPEAGPPYAVSSSNPIGDLIIEDRGAYVALVWRAGGASTTSTWPALASAFGLTGNPANTPTKDFVTVFQTGNLRFPIRTLIWDTETQAEFTTNIADIGVGAGGDILTFYGKQKGLRSPNPHTLRARVPVVKLDDPESPSAEITTGQYALVADASGTGPVRGTDLIFEDDFIRLTGGTLEQTLGVVEPNVSPVPLSSSKRAISVTTSVGNDWLVGNTGEAISVRDAAAGVVLYNGSLVMGPTPVRLADIADPTIFNKGTLIPEQMTFEPDPNDDDLDPEIRREIEALAQQLQLARVPQIRARKLLERLRSVVRARPEGYRNVAGNTSPVIMRRLVDEHGFRVSGKLWTNDTAGNPVAITGARTAVPGALFRWYEGYGVALNVSEGNEPNLFVVDNAAADRELTVVGEEVVGGKHVYSSLSQTTIDIQPSTWYNYELLYSAPGVGDPEHAVALNAWIWPSTGVRPVTPTISYGAYVPINRRASYLGFDDTGNYTGLATNTGEALHFGIGVSKTDATASWQFKDFRVSNIDAEYAQFVADFAVDAPVADEALSLVITARGQGYLAGPQYGYDVYVWNATTDVWTPAGGTVSGGYEFRTSRHTIPIRNHRDAGFVRVLISARGPHQGVSAVPLESRLEIDYIGALNYDQIEHTGGRADLYVSQGSPTDGPHETRTYVVPSASSLTELNPVDFGGPITQITAVRIVDGNNEVLATLQPHEYAYFWVNKALRGSMRERVSLWLGDAFAGLRVQVEADVHTSIPAVQTFLDTSSIKKVDTDILVRHRPLLFVDVSCTVTNNAQTVADQISLWLSQRFSFHVTRPDILSAVLSFGADISTGGTITLSARRLTSEGYFENVPLVDGAVVREELEMFVPGTISVVPA